LYQAIPEVMDSLDQVKDKLQDEFNVKPAIAKSGLEDLFGGAEPPSVDMPLAREIQKPENAYKVRKIIVEVIESQRQLKKDSKTAGYLLDCCAKAQALLAAAMKDGLRPESKLSGVAKQLDQIQVQVDGIRKYVAQHAKD
jgi:hypothetical protein